MTPFIMYIHGKAYEIPGAIPAAPQENPDVALSRKYFQQACPHKLFVVYSYSSGGYCKECNLTLSAYAIASLRGRDFAEEVSKHIKGEAVESEV